MGAAGRVAVAGAVGGGAGGARVPARASWPARRLDTGDRSVAPRAAISRGRTYRSPVPRFHCSLASSGPGERGATQRAAYHRSAGRAAARPAGRLPAQRRGRRGPTAALRATIGPDGSPPRGPALAGPAPSTLHRSARARAKVRPVDAVAHPARAATAASSAGAASPCVTKAFLAVSDRRAGRGDPVGRQRRGRARSSPRSCSGFGGFVDTGRRRGRQPARPPRRRPISDAPSIAAPERAVHERRTRSTSPSTSRPRSPASSGYTVRLYVTLERRRTRWSSCRGAGRADVGPGLPGVDARARAATTSRPRSSGPGGESERSAVATWVLDTVEAQGQRHLAQGQRAGQEGRRSRSRARPRPAARSASPTRQRRDRHRRSPARTGSGRRRSRSRDGQQRDHGHRRPTRRATRTRRRSTCARARAS